MVFKFVAAVAITLANIQSATASRGFQRLYSPTTNYSRTEEQVEDAGLILDPIGEPKPNLQQDSPAFKERNLKVMNFIKGKKVRFQGFKDGVPKWGLVVSSNNFTKISQCERMVNVEL